MWLYSNKNKKNKGYVLLITLIFMQLLSCLGLYSLHQALLITKMNNHRWYSKKIEIETHKYLKQIEVRINTILPDCVVSITPAFLLAQHSLKWWQLYACNENHYSAEINYYFVIEKLEKDNCGQIILNQMIVLNSRVLPKQQSDEKIYVAQYYRLTLLSQTDKLRGAKLILQSTIAVPERPSGECQSVTHQVRLGRQSWREL